LSGPAVGVRLDDAAREELAAIDGSGPFGPEQRPMGGYTSLPAAWRATPDLAAYWGLISTAGSSGTRDRKNCLSSSLGFGISMGVRSSLRLGGLICGLDNTERRSLRVTHHCDAADRGIERPSQDRAAQFGDLRDGGVGVRDGEVHAPVI